MLMRMKDDNCLDKYITETTGASKQSNVEKTVCRVE